MTTKSIHALSSKKNVTDVTYTNTSKLLQESLTVTTRLVILTLDWWQAFTGSVDLKKSVIKQKRTNYDMVFQTITLSC